MFITVFLVYLPEIIGNALFFMISHEPYNNQIVSFQTFFSVFSKHLTNTVAMMTGDAPSNIVELSKTSSIMPFVMCLFIFRICIVVMNILIGLTVSKIGYILEKAELIRLEKTFNACKLMQVFLNKRNDREWTKIEFSLDRNPTIWNYLVDAQIEDFTNSSALIQASVYNEEGLLFYCDLPCWIGIRAKNILKERKAADGKKEKADGITTANEQNKEIKEICVEMTQQQKETAQEQKKMVQEQQKMMQQQKEMMIKISANEKELKTIIDKLQANSDLQNRYLQSSEEVNSLKENLEAVLKNHAQLKERLGPSN